MYIHSGSISLGEAMEGAPSRELRAQFVLVYYFYIYIYIYIYIYVSVYVFMKAEGRRSLPCILQAHGARPYQISIARCKDITTIMHPEPTLNPEI